MNSVIELIDELKAGRLVILVDDENRENEGDLVFAADFVTPEKITFMARNGCGLICLAMSEEQIQRLKIPLMIRKDFNLSPNKTAFTLSIEARHGVTTGISAADRAHTIYVASRPDCDFNDLIVPGHVFPIQACKEGVLKRAGHTEASVDLCQLAGLNSAAVICEIMNEDGTMARFDDLKRFSLKHNIKMGTIASLIEYRLNDKNSLPLNNPIHLQTSAHENRGLL